MTKLDLDHLRRIRGLLDALPEDIDLGRAIIALEDAQVICAMALQSNLTFARARELEREVVDKEETRRIFAPDGKWAS